MNEYNQQVLDALNNIYLSIDSIKIPDNSYIMCILIFILICVLISINISLIILIKQNKKGI